MTPCLEDEAAPMPRVPSPSFLAAVLPALLVAACGEAGPPPVPPLPPEALEAVAENPGVDREKLARAIDTLFTAEGIGETRAVVVIARWRRSWPSVTPTDTIATRDLSAGRCRRR
jgi:hypothetical protein